MPEHGPVPSRTTMYEAMLTGLSAEVQLVRAAEEGAGWEGKQRRFASNGMSVCLERARLYADQGLFEVATPECEGPEALVLRLRAIDDQLIRALPRAQQALAELGHIGRFTLLKNSRDPEGSYYGRQENFDVLFASGIWLWIWWIGLLGLLPLIGLSFFWVLLRMVFGTVLLLPQHAIDLSSPESIEGHPAFVRLIEQATDHHAWALSWLLRLAEWVGFRQLRGPLEGFLVSRQVVSGTGWVHPDQHFSLSEKGAGINRWFSRNIVPGADEHAVFATSNLVKLVMRIQDVPRAFRARQRLQIGLADSNRCEVAEVVGITATARVVELIEQGGLQDAPRFADPVQALHTLSDASLQATVLDTEGHSWTALELQQFYQQRTLRAFPDDPILALWGEALQGLAEAPKRWIGRVDWVSKRWLLDQVAAETPWQVQKRVDIGYHELGAHGLYDRVMNVVAPPPLLDPEAVAVAAIEPPSGPASHRAATIRLHADELESVEWGRVRLRDKVVFLFH